MQLTSAELYVLTSKRNNYHLHFNFFAAFCTHKKLFDVKGDLSREPDAQEKPKNEKCVKIRCVSIKNQAT